MKNGTTQIELIENGSVTSPAGFLAAGVVAGFKKSKKSDFAMLYSQYDCNAAGTFTSNLFPAAPVQLCRKRIEERVPIRAVIVNSGVANACTGKEGYDNSCKSAQMAADILNLKEENILTASTGRIGVQLPMDILAGGIKMASSALSVNGGFDAAQAIMTTDTKPKSVAVKFQINGKTVTVGGMTKGAGMIAPGMIVCRPHATMLCFITTDAVVSADDLTDFLNASVDQSFNRITVDNDMSTNDTCVVLANGASGVDVKAGTQEADLFCEALNTVTAALARAMVMDGEGVTKFVAVEVKGAANDHDARICARAIANSMLCKTAWFGCDPNWGRVLAAAGYSGAKFDPDLVNMDYDEMAVIRGGMDAGTPEKMLCEVIKRREFTIHLNLGAGDAEHTIWTSDISHDYVTINADYHT